MENNRGRVLAYTLAKVIEHGEWAAISGGGGGQLVTIKPTVKMSGHLEPDAIDDMRQD